MDIIVEIKRLIANGENDIAIEKLMEYAKSQEGDFENKAIIIASRYKDYAKNKSLGLNPESEELRKIQYSIIKLLPKTEDIDYDFLKYFNGDLPEDDLNLIIDDLPLSDTMIFKRGFAGLERKFDWLCKLFFTVDYQSIKVLPAAENNPTKLIVDQVSTDQNIEVYSKNASTIRYFGWWNMKAAKDGEFWSNSNQKSKEMIDEKLKSDDGFRLFINKKLQKEIAKKTNFHEDENVEIDSILLFNISTVKFNS